MGFGPSAISRIGDYFYYNKWDLSEYFKFLEQKKIPADREFILRKKDKISRFFIKGFQKRKLDLEEFRILFKCDIPKMFKKKIEQLVALELVQQKDRTLCLTKKGLLVFDFIEKYFYPEEFWI